MSRLNQLMPTLRFVFLGLLLLATFGPWGYDRLYIPAQYTCSAPNIRLEGDFCGAPIAGFQMLAIVVLSIPTLIFNILTGDTANMDVRSLFFMFLFVLSILLPVLTTFLAFRREPRRRWQVYNLLAWGLAIGMGLFIGLSNSAITYTRLWGIWLLVALASGAVLLEAIKLILGRNISTKLVL